MAIYEFLFLCTFMYVNWLDVKQFTLYRKTLNCKKAKYGYINFDSIVKTLIEREKLGVRMLESPNNCENFTDFV